MTRELHNMSLEEYLQILTKIRNYAKAVCFYVMGEPFLNPQWEQIVSITHDAGIRTIISSNGMLLQKNMEGIFRSKLDHIQIALDGIDAITHEAYRAGSNFDSIIEALILLSQERQKFHHSIPEVTIQTLATKLNEHQINEIRDFAHALGFKFKLKKMHYGRTEELERKNQPVFMPQDPSLVRVKGKNYYSEKIECPELQQMVILSNGVVVSCCVDYNGTYPIGNIYSQSVEEIWYGEKRNCFVEQFCSHNNQFCSNCDLF